mmetsp:Transcript_19520/g.62578  ORF Transcript_19520/g.62578 Transcript_19520/m.62578 type:complete len:410 (-) Transcript_19520:104-1333(-)
MHIARCWLCVTHWQGRFRSERALRAVLRGHSGVRGKVKLSNAHLLSSSSFFFFFFFFFLSSSSPSSSASAPTADIAALILGSFTSTPGSPVRRPLTKPGSRKLAPSEALELVLLRLPSPSLLLEASAPAAPPPSPIIDIISACCRSSSSSMSKSFPAPAPAPAPLLETAAWLEGGGADEAAPLPPDPSEVCSRAALRSASARASSMDTRRARASSGSRLGSTPPNSEKAPMPPPPPLPSSPVMTGDVISTSEGSTPLGMVIRWELLFLSTAAMKASSLASLVSCSPMLTTSTATLPFLSCLAIFTKRFSSASIGLPTKTTIRCPPFLFFLCLSASCAICRPAAKSALPPILMPVDAVRMRPMSSVGEQSTCTPGPAIVRMPTVLSGFCWVLLPHTRLAASCWASMRVGV